MRRPGLTTAALVTLLCALSPPATAATPSVVVAIDTSRSIPLETLAAMRETAAGALRELPEGTAVGVLAFDDEPRWVLTAGSVAEATTALGKLAPAGNYTLLDDALFTAARELAPGGVVLLLTDGRDENSATTLEDVSRACEARGVRVLALGAGARIDERTLRRLALLTGGSYLGELPTAQPVAVGEALATAAAAPPPAVERALAAPAPGTSRAGEGAPAPPEAANVPIALRTVPEPGATTGAEPAAGATPAASPLRWWWLALPLAVVAIAVPVAVWTKSRARQRTVPCKRCGTEVPADEDCPRCAAQEAEMALQERLRSRDLTRLEDTSELRMEAAAELITGVIDLDAIEKTRVIADQSLLLVREPGETQRSFLLRSDGAFAVGRDPRSNTLIMRDPALSAKHFKVVPDDGWFFIVDLDSTNGTYLNRRRVRAARLSSGDVIQAGQVELEFRSFLGQVA